MNSFGSEQFDQLSQGLQTAATSVDVAQSMFFVNPITAFITLIISYLGAIMIFLIPAMWLAQTLISYVPFVNYIAGGGAGGPGMGGPGMGGPGGGGGMLSGLPKMIVGAFLAMLCVTGSWLTVLSWGVTGTEAAVNAITQSSLFSGVDTAQAIKQYKALVDVYDNNEAATQYQTLLNKEESMASEMQNYYATYSPSDTDSAWLKKKQSYTSIVCKLQILSNKLTNSDYATQTGSDSSTSFKQHLSQTKASDQSTAPFKPSFISTSMEQSYGVELPSSSSN